MPFDMIPPRAIVFDCSRSNTTDYNRTLRFCLYFLTFTGRRAIRWFIWRLRITSLFLLLLRFYLFDL